MKKNVMMLLLSVLLMVLTACGSNSEGEVAQESGEGALENNDVKSLQETYIKTIHSVKGETVVTRIEGDGIIYIEKVKTEQDGLVDVYYYSFSDTQEQYERMLKNYTDGEMFTIIEQDEPALYIKVKAKNGQATNFKDVEDAAIKGSEFETYIE